MRSIAEANADQTEARGSEENVRLTVSVLMNVLEKLRTMDYARFTKVVEALFSKNDDGNDGASVISTMNVLEKLRTMDNARFTKVVEALFSKNDEGDDSAKMTNPEERASTGKAERSENYIPRHGKPREEEDEYGRISAEEAVGRIIKVLWGYERQFLA